jgi:poly(A) polymerase
MKLEYVESLILAHPFVKGFDQVSYCLNEEEIRVVAQGETSDVIANRKKEDIEGKEGAGPVYSTTFYIGLAIEPRPGTLKSSFSVEPWSHWIACSGSCWTAETGHFISND